MLRVHIIRVYITILLRKNTLGAYSDIIGLYGENNILPYCIAGTRFIIIVHALDKRIILFTRAFFNDDIIYYNIIVLCVHKKGTLQHFVHFGRALYTNLLCTHVAYEFTSGMHFECNFCTQLSIVRATSRLVGIILNVPFTGRRWHVYIYMYILKFNRSFRRARQQ